MFLDMSRTGEPHRGLGRLFVRKRTRWPHLWARTPCPSCLMEPRPQGRHVHAMHPGVHGAMEFMLPGRSVHVAHVTRAPSTVHGHFLTWKIAPMAAPAAPCPCAPSVPRCFYFGRKTDCACQDVSAAAEKRARWNCRWHPTMASVSTGIYTCASIRSQSVEATKFECQ